MRHFLFLLTFAAATTLLAQPGQYKLTLDFNDVMTKSDFADYGDHQLFCGNAGGMLDEFWFGKFADDSVLWMKRLQPYPLWAPMDIMPLQIAQWSNSTDIVFVARGRQDQTTNYSASVFKTDEDGNLLWSKQIVNESGTYDQLVMENNPLIVEDDGVIITLTGLSHLQVTKLDPDGALIFSKQLRVTEGNPSQNEGILFIPTSDGGYLSGFQCVGTPALIKLDNEFNITWSRRITGSSGIIGSIMEGENGLFYIGGKDNNSNAFIASVDASGNFVHYGRFFEGETFYSIDQLIQVNDSTILANARNGYALVNTNDLSYERIQFLDQLYFPQFYKNGTTFSMSARWSEYHYLNLDLYDPTCISYDRTSNNTLVEVTGSTVPVACNVVDMGVVVDFTTPVSGADGTLIHNCHLGIAETSESTFSVYPNPVTAGQFLQFSGDDLSAWANGEVVLTDLQGVTMATWPSSEELVVPESLSAGIYFMILKTGDKQTAQRIVIR